VELVERFVLMIQSANTHGRTVKTSYHDSLEIGKNVGVYVPSAVTQKLKITVIELIDGQEKKCPPHIELPGDAFIEIDNTADYQNVKIALVVQYKDQNFLFPLQGCVGQRGSVKQEERVRRLQGSRILFFSRAKMPSAPIKKKLKKLGITHMSFMFMVNDKVLRDPCRREVLLTTENSVGTEQRYHVNKRAYNAFVTNSEASSSLPPSETNSGFPFVSNMEMINCTSLPSEIFINATAPAHQCHYEIVEKEKQQTHFVPAFNSHNNYSGPTDNTHHIFNNYNNNNNNSNSNSNSNSNNNLYRNSSQLIFKDQEKIDREFGGAKRIRRMDDLFLAVDTVGMQNVSNNNHHQYYRNLPDIRKASQ